MSDTLGLPPNCLTNDPYSPFLRTRQTVDDSIETLRALLRCRSHRRWPGTMYIARRPASFFSTPLRRCKSSAIAFSPGPSLLLLYTGNIIPYTLI